MVLKSITLRQPDTFETVTLSETVSSVDESPKLIKTITLFQPLLPDESTPYGDIAYDSVSWDGVAESDTASRTITRTFSERFSAVGESTPDAAKHIIKNVDEVATAIASSQPIQFLVFEEVVGAVESSAFSGGTRIKALSEAISSAESPSLLGGLRSLAISESVSTIDSAPAIFGGLKTQAIDQVVGAAETVFTAFPGLRETEDTTVIHETVTAPAVVSSGNLGKFSAGTNSKTFTVSNVTEDPTKKLSTVSVWVDSIPPFNAKYAYDVAWEREWNESSETLDVKITLNWRTTPPDANNQISLSYEIRS